MLKCPKCNFDTSQLDIYQILELPETHPERKRWQQNPEHRRTLEFYAWFITPYSNAKLLDVGSGPGTVAVPISRLANVSQVICFDIDEQARQTLRGIKEKEGLDKIEITGEGLPWELPFEAEFFDIIICRYSMHHFANQPDIMREFYRCLRVGGLLLYSDPAMPEHSRDATHAIMLAREETFEGYRTYHEMMDLVSGSGFDIVAMRPYDYQRGTFEDYLSTTNPELKEPLLRGWLGLDEKTKRQLRWSGERKGPFITYQIVDVAARKVAEEATVLCV
jgi:SAM-dependent methyltransferase